MTDESRQRNTYYEARIALALAKAAAAGQAASGAGAFKSVKAAPFLAKGDGITNDGPAIQAALTALAGTGVSLWFPAGTYLISSAVTVPAGVTIWVAGAGGSVVSFTGGSAATVANQALVYGATPGTAAYNPAWFVATTIFVAPGTGSDQASGTSVGAPLATWREAVRRWGSTEPVLQTPGLVITFQGAGHTDDSDPVVFSPICFRGISPQITGSLIQVWTGAATLVAAKNRATPQLLDLTLPAGAAPNQLLINTSRGNATAWVYKASAGNWLLSQPMAIPAPPFGSNGTEDNGWTTGNTITGNTTTAINFVELRPVFPDANGPLTNGLYITRCTGLDPIGNSALLINDGVVMADCLMGRRVLVGSDFAGITALVGEGTVTNCNFTGGINCTAPTLGAPVFWYILAGIINNATFGVTGSSYALDADVIMVASSNNAGIGLMSLGLVFFDTAATLGVSGSSEMQVANQLSFGGPIIWGPGGGLSVLGTSHMSYPTGGGAAVATFTQTIANPLRLNAFSGATNGHSVTPGSPDVFNGAIAVTTAHLDAAAGVAGFGGNAFNPGGASISNLVN